MWKPPEKIRHELPLAHWPSRDAAQSAKLFQPIALGPARLQQRTWVPAMVPWRATEDGLVTEDNLAWYERFAKGRPGAIVVEATGIREVPSGPLLRIGHDRFVPGLRRLVERVRDASGGETRLFIQLIDFLTIRRRPPAETFFTRYLKLTDDHRQTMASLLGREVPDEELPMELLKLSDAELEGVLSPRELESLRFGYRERVTDLGLPHIAELPQVLPGLFAEASARAEEAGFDGVELHFAHAYTMASFLSALNTRSDGYGGTLSGRVRLPIEVYESVRASTSERFSVGCRFLSTDALAAGTTVDEAAYFASAFARSGMDFLSLSRGGKFEDAQQPKVGWSAYPYTGPSGFECMPTVVADAAGPFGRNVADVATIRRALRDQGLETPVIVAGGVATFDQAEEILQKDQADIVGAARQSLADPDWFLKTRLGRGNEVRRCVFTNYCEGLDQKHKQVTCQLWDREQLDEPGIALSDDSRRRLVAPPWSPEDSG